MIACFLLKIPEKLKSTGYNFESDRQQETRTHTQASKPNQKKNRNR